MVQLHVHIELLDTSRSRLEENMRLAPVAARRFAFSLALLGAVLLLSLLSVPATWAGLTQTLGKPPWQWGDARNPTDARYSRASVGHTIGRLDLRTDLPAPPALKPDVVVILSESLWDPAPLLEHGVSFSRDPVPNLHALQRETGNLRFLSPSFAGDTANAEFELLTGFSTAFHRKGYVPYVEAPFRNRQPSIVRYFSSMGYRTLSVHNNDRTVWHRHHVHPRLGFDQFDGAETFEHASCKGDYLADAALGDRLIEELQPEGPPRFLFGITMQNHGVYRPDRYAAHDVKVLAPSLSSLQQANLQTYVQGLYDTDQMLGRIVTHLRSSSRPTVLIYFGDHLPAIGQEDDVLRALGIVSGQATVQDQLTLHSTPAVVWANYPLKLQYEQRIMSPGMVWPELLQAMGMEHPFYTRFLNQVRRELPAISRKLYVDRNGTPIALPPERAHAILSDYRLLQHDLMEGQRFGVEALVTPKEATTLLKPCGRPPRAQPQPTAAK